MRIGLIGTGRMGAAVEQAAKRRDWLIAERFDSERPLAHAETTGLAGLDVIIDFSAPHVFLDHVRLCVEHGLPLVSGTTGIGEDLSLAREYVVANSGAVLHSPNFSLGIAILRSAIRASASIVRRVSSYDVRIDEVHHTAKRDRPSGTALLLENDLRDATANLEITSARMGSVVGEHTVRFEGPNDQLVFRHTARSREIFTHGALVAAAWLMNRTGFFTLDDILEDWRHAPEPFYGNGNRTGHALYG